MGYDLFWQAVCTSNCMVLRAIWDKNPSTCFRKLTRAIYPQSPENNMQFLVNYTVHEIFLKRMTFTFWCSSKKSSFPSSTLLDSANDPVLTNIYQFFKALHEIDTGSCLGLILDELQVANTLPNQ